MNEQNRQIYRKESLDRLSSPDQLNDYLHVTGPAVWMVFAAAMLLLTGLFVWSAFASVESYAEGTAEVRDSALVITFDDQRIAENIETGMNVTVGSMQTRVSSVGTDDAGKIIALANANVPDGTYRVKIAYKQTQIIGFLFN